jgi:hypothetical protein
MGVWYNEGVVEYIYTRPKKRKKGIRRGSRLSPYSPSATYPIVLIGGFVESMWVQPLLDAIER